MDRAQANRALDVMTDLLNEARYAVNYPDSRRSELALRALIDRAQTLLGAVAPERTIDLANERSKS